MKRNINIELSDEDAKKVMDTCGRYNVSLGELVASFLQDLVMSDKSNGLDERLLIADWFARCGYTERRDTSFLSHLLELCYDPCEYQNSPESMKDEEVSYNPKFDQKCRKKELRLINDWIKEYNSFVSREDKSMTLKELRAMSHLSQIEYAKHFEIPVQSFKSWDSNPSSSTYRTIPEYILLLLQKATLYDIEHGNL